MIYNCFVILCDKIAATLRDEYKSGEKNKMRVELTDN